MVLAFIVINMHMRQMKVFSEYLRQFVGNEAKGRISKRVLQEDKARESTVFLVLRFPVNIYHNSSVIRQKGESQNGFYKKTKPAKALFFWF